MKNIQKNMLIRCTLREKYDENTGIYEYIDIFMQEDSLCLRIYKKYIHGSYKKNEQDTLK